MVVVIAIGVPTSGLMAAGTSMTRVFTATSSTSDPIRSPSLPSSEYARRNAMLREFRGLLPASSIEVPVGSSATRKRSSRVSVSPLDRFQPPRSP